MSYKKNEMNEGESTFERPRQKFATQMDSELLRQLRDYARSEGRQIQSVLEEAIAKLLKEQQGYRMRPDLAATYMESLDRYSELYKALAK